MLSSARRLRAVEVRETLVRGRSLRGAYLSVKFLKKDGSLRAAAVVSKKVAKTAVRRNSIRRALYTALRTATLPENISAVFIVHTVPPRPLTEALRGDILQICSKHFS